MTREKLQLVGVAAMLIASKYEEIYAPECRDFVYISDKAYTREQILSTEGNMLAKLNFQPLQLLGPISAKLMDIMVHMFR